MFEAQTSRNMSKITLLVKLVLKNVRVIFQQSSLHKVKLVFVLL